MSLELDEVAGATRFMFWLVERTNARERYTLTRVVPLCYTSKPDGWQPIPHSACPPNAHAPSRRAGKASLTAPLAQFAGQPSPALRVSSALLKACRPTLHMLGRLLKPTAPRWQVWRHNGAALVWRCAACATASRGRLRVVVSGYSRAAAGARRPSVACAAPTTVYHARHKGQTCPALSPASAAPTAS